MTEIVQNLQRKLERISNQLLSSEGTFRDLIRQNADGMVILDDGGRIVLCNPAARDLFARSREELLGTELGIPIVHGEPAELEIPHPDGSLLVVEMRTTPVVWDEAPATLASLRDITERKRMERELAESRERYALAIQGANDGIWDVDLNAAEAFFSARWKGMLGYAESEIPPTLEGWFGLVHPEDRELLRLEFQAHLDGSTPTFSNEHRLRHRDGRYLWVLARGQAVRDENGVARRVAGSLTDISLRKETEERLARVALHDALTGLPNRALLYERIEHCIRRARRRPSSLFAVLFIDLDRFKVVNDSLGHMVGDLLLKEIAERLTHCVRPGDTVARIGGDEFTLLLDDIRGNRDAVRVARRVQDELAKPFHLEGHEVFTRASIGIALGALDYAKPEDVLRDADAAMYRARSRGRGRYEMFDRRMHRDALEVLQLETDLRHALERNEFEVFYQPIVDLLTGTVEGFEALLRWRHPERGLLAPAAFLEVARECGVLTAVDRWVMERACTDLVRWRDRRPLGRPLSVSVNLPVDQLEEPNLVGEVHGILARTGLEPERLRLEISENELQHESEQSVITLLQLRDLGVGLYVDDFGAGFSCMSRLTALPSDILKIDRSFVSGMDELPEQRKIVRTIVHLARNLQMGVIAEGVESVAQVHELRRAGCGSGQGFYFAEPLPADEAEDLARAESIMPF